MLLISFFSFPLQDDSFNQDGKHADNQINIKCKESPDQQCEADGSVFKNVLEIQQESAFLCAADSGKRRIAGADKQKAADRQHLIPGRTGHAKCIIYKYPIPL